MMADWTRWRGRWAVMLSATDSEERRPQASDVIRVYGIAPWGERHAQARLVRRLAGGPNIGFRGWAEVWMARRARNDEV